MTTSDLNITIADDIVNGAVLGQVTATTNTGDISYSIASQTLDNTIAINANNGELTLSNQDVIDAVQLSEIEVVVTVSNGIKDTTSNVSIKVTPAVKSPKTVMYVEVNSFNMLNVGAYELDNGKPFFDYAMVFGANINYDAQNDRPLLFFNSNTQTVLDNSDLSIKPLQDKGIKVLLSILGNRQRYGFANFPDRETAADFAAQVAQAVETYNLDGVDLDDEFVNYGDSGVPQSNEFSFMFLIEELRRLMPDKLITFYNIGESSRFTSYNGVEAGSILDYSWQPFYALYNASGLPEGLPTEKYSASAINISVNPLATALDFASRTKQDGFGAYMMYNLTDIDYTFYLNAVSEELYDQGTVRSERIRGKDDFEN